MWSVTTVAERDLQPICVDFGHLAETDLSQSLSLSLAVGREVVEFFWLLLSL